MTDITEGWASVGAARVPGETPMEPRRTTGTRFRRLTMGEGLQIRLSL
jgi:hypothetical protein